MNGISPKDSAILQGLEQTLAQLPPDANGIQEAMKISLKEYQVARRHSYELSEKIHQKFGLEESLKEVEERYPGMLGRINRLSNRTLKFATLQILRDANSVDLSYLFCPPEELIQESIHNLPHWQTSRCIVHYRLEEMQETRPDLIAAAKAEEVEAPWTSSSIFMSVGKLRALSIQELEKYAKKMMPNHLHFLTDDQVALLSLNTLSPAQINAALTGPTESKRSFLRRYNRISKEMRDACAIHLNYEHLRMLDELAIKDFPVQKLSLDTLRAHFGGEENRQRFSWLREEQILRAIDKLIHCVVDTGQLPDAVIQKIEPKIIDQALAMWIIVWPPEKIHQFSRETVYHLMQWPRFEDILSPKQIEEFHEDVRNEEVDRVRNYNAAPPSPKKRCVVQ